jgi:hypothetical protein
MAKYVNNEKLTDKVIEDVLNKCGFELIREKHDDYIGETVKIEPIMRYNDRIIVSCLNKETSNLANAVFARFPMLGYFSRGAYSMGEEIVTFDDYFAERFKMSDELDSLDKELFETYHQTMCGLFGEEYERDSREHFDKILEEEAKNKETENQEPKKEENGSEMGL